jgi:DHA1 family inner membrane transport protein
MGIFTLGNLLAAIAPDYWTLLAARVITSLSHGAFFGFGTVLAASLAPPGKGADAVASMFTGLTVANIGGVPAATWLGHAIGWRMSFMAIAIVGVLAITSLILACPLGAPGHRPDVRRELSVLKQSAVLSALATTVLGAGAMFTLYTYVAPTLQYFVGTTPSFLTAMLVLIGVGFSIGNYLGGRFAERSVDGALVIFLGALAIIMLSFPIVAGNSVGAAIALVLWGAASFGIVPPTQIRVMNAAADATDLASSVNIGAFNFGNALGASVGGAVISQGLGYGTVPIAGAVLACVAIVLILLERVRLAQSAVGPTNKP